MEEIRKESEIIAGWQGNIEAPKVSVCCITYNHGKYIEEALQGFLMQITDFPFEVLINDDASTDRTSEIIRSYANKYPKIIKPIFQTENQYSKGNIKPNSSFNYPRAKGEFIAFCEGDDYWCNPFKLQMQISGLTAHPKIGLSIHPAIKLDVRTLKEEGMGFYRDDDGLVSVEEIIEKRLGGIPLASTMIRRSLIYNIADFMRENNTTVGDIYIHFFGSHEGKGALYINKKMSVYRVSVPESWSMSFTGSDTFQISHIMNKIQSYEKLNTYTSGAYQKSFRFSSYTSVKYFLKSNSIFKRKIKVLFSFIELFTLRHQISLITLLLLHPLLPAARILQQLARQVR